MQPNKPLIVGLLILAVALVGADLYLTAVIQDLGGHELNPVMPPTVNDMIPIRIAEIFLVLGAIIVSEKTMPGSGHLAPLGVSCVTCWPVVWNLAWIGGLSAGVA